MVEMILGAVLRTSWASGLRVGLDNPWEEVSSGGRVSETTGERVELVCGTQAVITSSMRVRINCAAINFLILCIRFAFMFGSCVIFIVPDIGL